MAPPTRPSHLLVEFEMTTLRTSLNLGLLGALAITAAAVLLPQPMQAQASPPFKVTVPVPAFVTLACNGEIVAFPDGATMTLERTRTDSSGGVHFKSQFKFLADNGVGVVTQLRYRLATISNTESQMTNPPGTITDTNTSSTHLTGQGPENNLLVHVTAKMTTNNNGMTTVDFVKINFDCPADGSLP
jgi:hypothetical protein